MAALAGIAAFGAVLIASHNANGQPALKLSFAAGLVVAAGIFLGIEKLGVVQEPESEHLSLMSTPGGHGSSIEQKPGDNASLKPR